MSCKTILRRSWPCSLSATRPYFWLNDRCDEFAHNCLLIMLRHCVRMEHNSLSVPQHSDGMMFALRSSRSEAFLWATLRIYQSPHIPLALWVLPPIDHTAG